jgi:hypothetical protein
MPHRLIVLRIYNYIICSSSPLFTIVQPKSSSNDGIDKYDETGPLMGVLALQGPLKAA